jgi:hypothetical protein
MIKETNFINKAMAWSGCCGGTPERTRQIPFFRLVSEGKVSVEEFKDLKSDDLQDPPCFFQETDKGPIEKFMLGNVTVHRMAK